VHCTVLCAALHCSVRGSAVRVQSIAVCAVCAVCVQCMQCVLSTITGDSDGAVLGREPSGGEEADVVERDCYR
jgi:hypothetical protein